MIKRKEIRGGYQFKFIKVLGPILHYQFFLHTFNLIYA